jgi:hypothetical protein
MSIARTLALAAGLSIVETFASIAFDSFPWKPERALPFLVAVVAAVAVAAPARV